jgi:signal transduction histidine kinase/ActR/RegA family two-component response regulator
MDSGKPEAPQVFDPPAAKAECFNQAFANEPAGLIGSAFGACMLAFVQAPLVGNASAWLWCAALLAITAGRLCLHLIWRRHPVTPPDYGPRPVLFRTGVLLSGLAWGAAALFLYPDGSPLHQIFTAFMIGGMVAGAVGIYSALPWTFPPFAMAAILPILVRAVFSETGLHNAMAVMMFLYGILMAAISRNIQGAAWAAIRLKFENRDLLSALSRTMEETLELNATLKTEILERQKIEAELHRHQEQLEGMVALRTGELSAANRGLREALEEKVRMEEEHRRLGEQLQLARKMESLATLAGGVAHDFNNLLMGIGGQISLLMSARQAGDPELEKLESMERQVRDGADLTRQLLGLAMGGKYEVKAIDVNALVRRVAVLFSRTHKDTRVTTRLEEGLGTVEADKGQLEQALLNICLNARQAMPEGGTVDLSTCLATIREEQAEAFGTKAGRFAVISVADTGKGLDQSVLPRIFDPFFTANQTAGGLRSGRTDTGLGLSSAYGIVRNHGGFIDVHSEPDHGSTFSLYLPHSTAPAPAREGTEASKEAGPIRKTVLLVDDEPVVADVAALMLQRLGFRVLKALSGEAALARFRGREGEGHPANGIDLVILDMIMPGMSGDETFRRMKELKPDLPVLLSSGYSLEERAQELIQAGSLGFLQKPYNLAELRSKLEDVLGASAMPIQEDAPAVTG